MNSYTHQHFFVAFGFSKCVKFTGLSNCDDVNKNFGFFSCNAVADTRKYALQECQKVVNTANQKTIPI